MGLFAEPVADEAIRVRFDTERLIAGALLSPPISPTFVLLPAPAPAPIIVLQTAGV